MSALVISRNVFSFDFSDSANVKWRHASEASRNESLAQSIEYFINDDKIAQRFGHTLDPLLADWIDVALACYLADRLATRGTTLVDQPGRYWSRVLNLTVPVRQTDCWNNAEVQSDLVRLLHFFTEDAWHFEFVPRTAARRLAESQGFLFGFESGKRVRVSLYSGGLDSFAGAAQMLGEYPAHAHVFVSGVTNVRQQAAQRAQLRALQSKTRDKICHVIVPYGLRWAGAHVHRKEEASQRTRGFLFLTLGAVSAMAASATKLLLCENGVGAINLPYDGTQIGSYNSRATNPAALLRMEGFIRVLTKQEMAIENPFLFYTKGEMCGQKLVKELGEYLHLTFSCDGFPVRAKNRAQCGSCTSCLLRRQALECAGLSEFDQRGYLKDLLAPGFVGTQKQMHVLRAMDWQAQKIKSALAQPNSWEALVDEFIELQKLELEVCRAGKMQLSEFRANLLRLYSRYTTEWESFSARQHCYGEKRMA